MSGATVDPAVRTFEMGAVRVGLVGCGRVASKHATALEAQGREVEMVGVVDPCEARRGEMAERFGVEGYDEMKRMLEEGRPELVALATPTGMHPEQAKVAAKAGAHILCEKPLGTRLDRAVEMVREVARLERQLFVVKQLRYHPMFLALREAIEEGRFGRIHTVGMQIFWTRPQAYYDAAGWRGSEAMDGGALTNQASHYVDLMDWLFGPVASVQAVGGALGRDIEAEDTSVMTLEWERGIVGSMHVTMLSYPQNLATNLTVIGERGTVRLGGPRCDRVEAWSFEEVRPVDQRVRSLNDEVGEVLAGGHRWVYEDVLKRLDGRCVDVVDGMSGLRSLAIIEAAKRSYASGAREAVPAAFGEDHQANERGVA